jgi:hypothetical protein
MKKFLVTILLLLSVSFGYFSAQTTQTNSDWFFFFSKLESTQYGYFGEYVYSLDSTNSTYKKLSYLEWETTPVENLGFQITGGYKRFSITGYATDGISSRCGSMSDSDWMALDDVKTNYSISENTLNAKANTGITLQFDFYPVKDFILSPAASCDYEYISFSARNGYGWYGDSANSSTGTDVSYDSPYAQKYVAGQLCPIGYSRASLYTWIGLKTKVTMNEKYAAGTSLFVSPYTYVSSIDKHYQNMSKTYYVAYNDIMSGTFCYIKSNLFFTYSINHLFSLTASADILSGISPLGVTYTAVGTSSHLGKAYLLSSKSMSDVYVFSTTVAFQIRFF